MKAAVVPELGTKLKIRDTDAVDASPLRCAGATTFGQVPARLVFGF